MEFQLLLDAPSTGTNKVQIAKLGDDFKHPKHGKFAITADDVNDWAKNLDLLPGGRAPIDEDHMADRLPRRTEASGWITGVGLDGKKVMADVEWTDKGTDAIGNKRYLFFSPTFGPHRDEQGEVHPNVLVGGALTNKPFLNMPTLTLASDERVSEAIDQDPAARFFTHALDGELGELATALVTLDVSQAHRDQAVKDGHALPDGSYPITNTKELRSAAVLAASGHGNVAGAKKLIRKRAKDLGVDVNTLPGFADSRGPMIKKLAIALGLDDAELLTALDSGEPDEATEQKLLDAIEALKAKPTKSLEQAAADEKKVLLDQAGYNLLQDRVKTLEATAADGVEARKELHAAKFDTAWDAAKKARKVTDNQRERYEHFYELDAPGTLAMINDLTPLVPARPNGDPIIELDLESADPTELAAAGLDPAGHSADRKVRAKLKELGKPESEYNTVLLDMMNGGEL